MKFLKNIILILLFILLGYEVYINKETVNAYFRKIMATYKDIEIKEPNEYARNYNIKKFTYDEDYKPYNKTDLENILFNILNNGYDTFTFYCPKEYNNCLSDITDIANDSHMLSMINNYVSPFNSFVYLDTITNSLGEITIKVTKNYSDFEIKQINAKIDEILNELNIDNLSKKEQIDKIHEYLINNVEYDNDYDENIGNHYSETANGAFLYGKGICSGYSDAFALFMDRLNIPNIKVASNDHVWNLIYIDNSWKHVDVTWDDTRSSTVLGYKFYLINTEKLLSIDSKDHTFDQSFYIEAK
jgi:hypothetical protein